MTPSAERRAAIACPQTTERTEAIEPRVGAFAARAEHLGFSGIWTCELTTAKLLDPLLLLAHCAAVTERVRLGVAVLLTALRSPLRLAQETVTLDRMSGGRLIVGVGLGGNPALYSKHGLPATGRARRFEDGLQLLLRLWEGTSPRRTGELWELDGTEPVPPPLQRPRPPLWFGARSEAGLRRAVRLGDGFVGSGSESTGTFATRVAAVRRVLDDHGEDKPFAIAKRLYVVIDDDRRRARRRARTWFGHNYGNEGLAERVAALGRPEDCAAAAAELLETGADTVIFNPVDEELEQMERLVAEVIPAIPADLRPRLAEVASPPAARESPST